MPMVTSIPFRMHTNVEDLASQRVANQFGFAGLADPEDPRETGKVLPMTRGSTGFFYREGSGERRQLSEDAHFRGHWGVDRTGLYRPGVHRRGAMEGLGLPVYYADGAYGYGVPSSVPSYPPMYPGGTQGGPPVALAPNQSVPPSTTLTPLPTGTGTSGGNVILTPPPTSAPATTDNTWLYLALSAGALLLLSGGR